MERLDILFCIFLVFIYFLIDCTTTDLSIPNDKESVFSELVLSDCEISPKWQENTSVVIKESVFSDWGIIH